MGNLILNFLQEQGILIVMGLMVLEGIVHQWVASRRYRRLRTGLQALAASGSGTAERGQTEILRQGGQVTYGKRTETAAESMAESRNGSGKRGRRASRRQEVGRYVPERVNGLERNQVQESQQLQQTPQSQQATQSQQELDAQLLYLKQSLDRIAAGRDQKLEEEPREHRKLTPEQEAIIADILREYLS